MLKILLVILLLALIVYGVTRAIERRGIAPAPGRRTPPRPVAPDDDPDFLWDIERRRRHQAKDPTPEPEPSPEPEVDGPATDEPDQDNEAGDSDSSGTT